MNQARPHPEAQVLHLLLAVARKRLTTLEASLANAQSHGEAGELRQAIRETRTAINLGERLAL